MDLREIAGADVEFIEPEEEDYRYIYSRDGLRPEPVDSGTIYRIYCDRSDNGDILSGSIGGSNEMELFYGILYPG